MYAKNQNQNGQVSNQGANQNTNNLDQPSSDMENHAFKDYEVATEAL